MTATTSITRYASLIADAPVYPTEYACEPQPRDSCGQTAYKVGRLFLRTVLVLPILYDIARAFFRWVAGKVVHPAACNSDAIRVVGYIFRFTFGILAAPLCIYGSLPERWNWKSKLLVTFMCAVTALPLLAMWAKIFIDGLCAEPSYGESKDRDTERNRELSYNMRERAVRPTEAAVLKRLTLTTPDGCNLDGMLYVPGHIKDEKLDKLVIRTGGNGQYYEYSLHEARREADELGVPVLLFNPRDVGESTGTTSPEGLALDVYTAYKYGIEALVIDPNNILLHGYSLGGSYGAMGAALIQQEYPDARINMVSERSFRNLPDTALHLLGNGKIGKIAKAILRWTGWEMNAEAAIRTLRGRKLVIHLVDDVDEVIKPAASMHQALQGAAELPPRNCPVDFSITDFEFVTFKMIKMDSYVFQHGRPILAFEKLRINELKRNYLNFRAQQSVTSEAEVDADGWASELDPELDSSATIAVLNQRCQEKLAQIIPDGDRESRWARLEATLAQ